MLEICYFDLDNSYGPFSNHIFCKFSFFWILCVMLFVYLYRLQCFWKKKQNFFDYENDWKGKKKTEMQHHSLLVYCKPPYFFGSLKLISSWREVYTQGYCKKKNTNSPTIIVENAHFKIIMIVQIICALFIKIILFLCSFFLCIFFFANIAVLQMVKITLNIVRNAMSNDDNPQKQSTNIQNRSHHNRKTNASKQKWNLCAEKRKQKTLSDSPIVPYDIWINSLYSAFQLRFRWLCVYCVCCGIFFAFFLHHYFSFLRLWNFSLCTIFFMYCCCDGI